MAFENIKNLLKCRPILVSPNFDIPSKLAVDASNIGAGAVLMQSDENSVDHPVCYFSKKKVLLKKIILLGTEKELLPMIMALQVFSVYLPPSGPMITIFTDHHPLKFLDKFKHKNQRLTRWSLFLQEYCLSIQHIKGVNNVLANSLSRA